jgi:hypothetical protein
MPNLNTTFEAPDLDGKCHRTERRLRKVKERRRGYGLKAAREVMDGGLEAAARQRPELKIQVRLVDFCLVHAFIESRR